MLQSVGGGEDRKRNSSPVPSGGLKAALFQGTGHCAGRLSSDWYVSKIFVPEVKLDEQKEAGGRE